MAPGRLRDAIPNVFGGAITVRPNSRLHLGRSRGRLSVGPEAHNGNSGCGGCLLGNFGAELSDQSEMIRVRVSKGFSTWSASIAGVIAEAQAEGQISKDLPDLPARTLAAFVLNGWEGALVRARVDKSKAPLEQFVKVTFAKTLAP